jgi:hypothetical protein
MAWPALRDLDEAALDAGREGLDPSPSAARGTW